VGVQNRKPTMEGAWIFSGITEFGSFFREREKKMHSVHASE